MVSLSLTMLSPLPVYLDEATAGSKLAARSSTLDGKVVGLLPNWRPSAVHILKAIGTLLEERYRLKAGLAGRFGHSARILASFMTLLHFVISARI